ncbi:jg19424 [Pararge aegeria aegeria]|uniref:Jg19424 protein n=1 Tax=Pararge aegeria aegeria TaxID=348720 RepID=A0A8S4RCE6_9NEOP|nr:jg19424 [Pararge aegeria aegeria]
MLDNNGFYCYADDSTGDALYKGPTQLSPSQLVECRSKLVSEIEGVLDKASEWGAQNIVQFNPTKTKSARLQLKKTAFTVRTLSSLFPIALGSSVSTSLELSPIPRSLGR